MIRPGRARRLAQRSAYQPERRPRWGLIGLLVLGHLAVGALLVRLLAPDFTASVVEQATSGFTVTITAPPTPPPADTPDEGAAGDPGRKAAARNTAAPESPLASPSPLPRTPATGSENDSGAQANGDGTGAAGPGDGTGSGNGGQGSGGGSAAAPSVRSGELNQARDFPVPEGGRQARFGRSVTVQFTVTTEGRARNCSVLQSGVDAAATALVCPLVIAKIRFNPATRADGTLVEARYGYRVDFRPR